MMERQRGQTLPLVLFGTIAMLVFGFFALNYANTVRWQIRAQSAADSAAQAVLTIQTQEFNAMNAALYAAAIEEYRIRFLLNGMVLAAHGEGGCAPGPACDNVEELLEPQYDAAVSRYTDDVRAMQQITLTLNYNNVTSDSNALLKHISTPGDPFNGDSAFNYAPLQISPRTNTEIVAMDAHRIVRPYPGHPTGASGVNTALFAPVEVEVSVCAVVPSLIPSFMGWSFAPFRAIARGAATPVMVEEDWLQPGAITNPWTQLPYQTPENYLGGTFNAWYDLNFGGNANVVVTDPITGDALGYSSTLGKSGFMSVYLGWWNSIPIHPFTGPKTAEELGCTS